MLSLISVALTLIVYIKYLHHTACHSLYGSQLWDYDNANIDMFMLHHKKLFAGYSTCQLQTIVIHYPIFVMIYHQNIQLYKCVISFVNGLSKYPKIIASLCYRLVVNGSVFSVSIKISILSTMRCVPWSRVCTTNKKTYPVSTCTDDSLAITCSVIRDILHMIHINNYFLNICILNDSELYWILNTLCTD